MGVAWAILGSSWADLRPSWQPHWLSWGYLGGLLGRLGLSDTQAGESLTTKTKLKEHQSFFCFLGLSWRASWSSFGELPWSFGASWCRLGRLGGLLARLTPSEAVLGASLGLLSAFWTRFGFVLGSSWESLGRSWGPLGQTWGALGGLLGCLGAILEAS